MKKKQCKKCGQRRLIKFFNKGLRGTHAWCQTCQRQYDSNRWATLPKDEKAAAIQKKILRQEETRRVIEQHKSKPCKDCGYSFPPYVMDFDHREPESKEFDISSAFQRKMSLERILDEIAKCDLVCANCHRIRTHKDTYRGVAQAGRALGSGSRGHRFNSCHPD